MVKTRMYEVIQDLEMFNFFAELFPFFNLFFISMGQNNDWQTPCRTTKDPLAVITVNNLD